MFTYLKDQRLLRAVRLTLMTLASLFQTLSNRKIELVGVLMLISLLGYTAFIGLAMPAQWLEPFGGLLKNLALMPAVLVLMALADRQ